LPNVVGGPMLTVPMKLALPVAAIGVLLAYAARERLGMIFAGTGLIFAAAVANLGEGPLWNARLLPFYYLSVYLLAAVAVAMAVRHAASLVSGSLLHPDRLTVAFASLAALAAVLVAVAMPLRLLPFGGLTDDGHYRWLAFTNSARSAVPSWAAWNYSGYEQKDSYREYHHVVTTMAEVADANGCGRAMWEYSKELDRYGTPMALMLLPHWTDGCVGSMEGLYFESSSTTPFHFLNQSVLSEAPSRAQRDLPYKAFDIDLGVTQLQTMGVRYYLAQTDKAIAAARSHPELTELAEAQPFIIFEVSDSELVEALDYEPVVVTGRTEEQLANSEVASRFDVGWVGQAVEYYNNPRSFLALPAEDGPPSWQRQESLLPTDGVPVEAAVISDVETTTSTLRFTVDQVGTPVLVKVSYFPNWEVDGADGPWRVGPNLMAVVPTATTVELSYGRTAVDWLGVLLTLLGLAAVGWLAYWSRRKQPDDRVAPAYPTRWSALPGRRAVSGPVAAEPKEPVFLVSDRAEPEGDGDGRVDGPDRAGSGSEAVPSARAAPAAGSTPGGQGSVEAANPTAPEDGSGTSGR
ncbi:MAG: 6-pyruvoyl-tetrahydropterin synthase-related protein, partial [Acidimicrobiia bacterium]|nr:6-pyruvoyl-tetrahydropterin synthase-related protein [Acidimicrobiia bacterium]